MTRLHYLYSALELSPIALKRIVLKVDPSKYDTKTAPDRFTLRQAVAHLADWEHFMFERVKTCVANPGGFTPGYDEGERAVEMNYDSWDVQTSLDRLIQERGETLAFIKSLNEVQLAQTATHPERGEMSTLDWAFTIAGHDVYHIEHAAEYL